MIYHRCQTTLCASLNIGELMKTNRFLQLHLMPTVAEQPWHSNKRKMGPYWNVNILSKIQPYHSYRKLLSKRNTMVLKKHMMLHCINVRSPMIFIWGYTQSDISFSNVNFYMWLIIIIVEWAINYITSLQYFNHFDT